MPNLLIVAGPNGSGKSTLTSFIWFRESQNIVDPDAIARRLDPMQPSRRSIPAAREAIRRCRSLLQSKTGFTLETTLAGNGAMSIMRRAKESGYRTLLIYVALGDPELHIERVRLRVAQGGHDIPDADVRRRYWRSLKRAPDALRLADEAVILDNSGKYPMRVMTLESGRIIWRTPAIPQWAFDISARLD